MKKIFFNIFVILTLSSCNNVENLSKAGNEIAKYCGTKDVTISFTNFTSTDNGSTESYKIDIKNVLEVNNGNYPPEYLASMSAKTLFDNLNNEERDNIIVKIEGSNKNFEYKYSMKDFSKVDQYFKITKEFIQKVKSGNLNDLSKYLNEDTFDLKDFKENMINGVIKKNQAEFNKIEKVDLHSINITSEKNLKITELITFAVLGDTHFKFSTRFIEKSPNKISGISIN
jgi:hypothetical protein